MYGLDILCGISKSTFDIPRKINYPYTDNVILLTDDNFRSLRFKSSYVFVKCPFGPPIQS